MTHDLTHGIHVSPDGLRIDVVRDEPSAEDRAPVRWHPARATTPEVRPAPGLPDLPAPADLAAERRAMRDEEGRERAACAVKTARDKLREARRAGVDLARATFMRRLLGATVNGLSVAVAAVLTAASGGVLVPLLAVATIRFVSAAADATAAYDGWRRAQRGEAPHPMGTNGFGQVLYECALRQGKSAPEALEVATRRSAKLQLGLATATLVACLPVGVVALPLQICRAVSTGLLTALGLGDRDLVRRQAEHDARVAQVQADCTRAVDEFAAQLGKAVPRDVQGRLMALAGWTDLDDPQRQGPMGSEAVPRLPAGPDPVRQRLVEDERARHKVVTGITFSSFVASCLGFVKLLGV